MKIYTNELSHITNMAALPIYGENLKKSSPEPLDRKCLSLACILRRVIQGLMALLFFFHSLCPVGLSLLNQKTLRHGQTILAFVS